MSENISAVKGNLVIEEQSSDNEKGEYFIIKEKFIFFLCPNK
jgi:hypothetical protein